MFIFDLLSTAAPHTSDARKSASIHLHHFHSSLPCPLAKRFCMRSRYDDVMIADGARKEVIACVIKMYLNLCATKISLL